MTKISSELVLFDYSTLLLTCGLSGRIAQRFDRHFMTPQRTTPDPKAASSQAVRPPPGIGASSPSVHLPAGQNQNISFNANWICREYVEVVVMTPAEEL